MTRKQNVNHFTLKKTYKKTLYILHAITIHNNKLKNKNTVLSTNIVKYLPFVKKNSLI